MKTCQKLSTQMLKDSGYKAKSVYEQGMAGWKDPELWQKVQDEGYFLITADKGFADIRKHPPGTHHGLLLLRPSQDGIRHHAELLKRVLEQYDINELAGTIAVVTPRGIRVRRPAS